ncbi:MAG: hypothetical protein FWG53_04630, partial [Clostridiales bacterium]|nr:hypothetical protein [Clostridiales bacterium]
QCEYSFAEAYSSVAEAAQGTSFEGVAMYMAEHDFDSEIRKTHMLIDEHIELLRRWETQTNTVYVDPYNDIGAVIDFERLYYLSKTGIGPDSEKWTQFKLLTASLDVHGHSYPITRDILRDRLDNPSRAWKLAKNYTLTDYVTARMNWEYVKETIDKYLEDTDISDDKKQWASQYMKSDPYGNMCKRLADRGKAWDGTRLKD